jgi:hypothetical protein
LRWADHSPNELYRLWKKKNYEPDEEAKARQSAVEPLMNKLMNEMGDVYKLVSALESVTQGVLTWKPNTLLYICSKPK